MCIWANKLHFLLSMFEEYLLLDPPHQLSCVQVCSSHAVGHDRILNTGTSLYVERSVYDITAEQTEQQHPSMNSKYCKRMNTWFRLLYFLMHYFMTAIIILTRTNTWCCCVVKEIEHFKTLIFTPSWDCEVEKIIVNVLRKELCNLHAVKVVVIVKEMWYTYSVEYTASLHITLTFVEIL